MPEGQMTQEEFDLERAEEKRKWLFKENIRLEQQREELERERTLLEQQKREFQREKERIDARNHLERKQIQQEKRLFEMKWKVLEDELTRLAEDRRRLEQERKACHEIRTAQYMPKLHYELFFIGVDSKQSLKKRYRDLLKIFHPDNMSGDKATLQEINREYDNLKQILY